MEKHHLLGDEDVEAKFGSSQTTTFKRTRPTILTYIVYVFLAASVLGNIFQYTRATTNARNFTIFPELHNLRTVVKNEHPEHGVKFSEFDGPPSNESAKAWRELLQPFYFNISSAELSAANFPTSTSVRVKNGGYLGSLAVYHELHCLNQFRTFLYLHTTSSPPTPIQNSEYWQAHLTHCIEVLRLSLMCSADLSLYTFTWPESLKNVDDLKNLASGSEGLSFLEAHSKSPRKCRDWSQIETWSMQRKISLVPTVVFPTDESGEGAGEDTGS